MEAFNDALYVGTGDPTTGYAVIKATSTTTPGALFTYTPIVVGGAGRGPEITSVVSMRVFKNRLYIGSNGWGDGSSFRSEEIRVNPDDSWDVVVGKARTVGGTPKAPISGLGDGFGNPFTAHMWRAETHNGAMYVGTNDASSAFANIPGVGSTLAPEFGFDLWGTCDGQYWWQVTRNAFGDGRWNFGARTIVSSPSGLFIGSANHVEGTSVWKGDASPCGTPVPFERVGGAAGANAGATSVAAPLPPQRVLADTQKCGMVLSWDATSGARRYRILRSEIAPSISTWLCSRESTGSPRVRCRLRHGPEVPRNASACGWQGRTARSDGTTKSSFVDGGAKPGGRYNYQVVAVGASGKLSQPSNVATTPSHAAPAPFGQLNLAVQRLIDSSSKTGAVKGATLMRLAQQSPRRAGSTPARPPLSRLSTGCEVPPFCRRPAVST